MADRAAAALFVDYYTTALVEKSSMAGMFALMLYELTITFDREVGLFWSMPLSRTTAIFILNRYASLLKYLVNMAAYQYNIPQTSCNILIRVGQALEIIPYVVWAMFSAMRVHALTRRNVWLSLVVFVLLCVPVGTNLYLFTILVPDAVGPPVGCTAIDNLPWAIYIVLLIITRACAILGDAIVIGVTWYKTFRGWRAAVAAEFKVSLSGMIIRDGSIYFIVLLCLNIMHVVTTLFTAFHGVVPTFEEPISSIMISRLMLNLREVDRSVRDATAPDEGTLRFERTAEVSRISRETTSE